MVVASQRAAVPLCPDARKNLPRHKSRVADGNAHLSKGYVLGEGVSWRSKVSTAVVYLPNLENRLGKTLLLLPRCGISP